jgi:hypothetical protein
MIISGNRRKQATLLICIFCIGIMTGLIFVQIRDQFNNRMEFIYPLGDTCYNRDNNTIYGLLKFDLSIENDMYKVNTIEFICHYIEEPIRVYSLCFVEFNEPLNTYWGQLFDTDPLLETSTVILFDMFRDFSLYSLYLDVEDMGYGFMIARYDEWGGEGIFIVDLFKWNFSRYELVSWFEYLDQ